MLLRKLFIVSLLLPTCLLAAAKTVIIGQTFPIAEQDTLSEIKENAAKRDWQSWMRRAPADYSAFSSVDLPRAPKNSTRLFDPTYAIPADIVDQNGKILFAKGTLVNIYTKIKYPGRFIVVGTGPDDFRWLDEVAKPTSADKVLIAGGNALIVRQNTGRQVFVMDKRFIERFGLRAVPAIVQQEGIQLRVNEYVVDIKEKK